MNLSGKLETVRLTTPDLVRAALPDEASSYATEDSKFTDAQLYDWIDEVSAEITEYLGWHTLRAERTEVYRIRRFANFVTLDGALPDVTSVRIGTDTANIATADAEVLGEDVIVAEGQHGLIIERGLSRVERYLQVVYTGGYFASSMDATNHRWLSSAAEKQVVYRIQRAATLGGNISQADGGGTQFEQGYSLLPHVRAMLRMHRRSGV